MNATFENLKSMLDAKLFTSAGKPVTIEAVLLALAMLTVGYWLAGWIRRRIEALLDRRPSLNPSERHLISTLFLYFLLAMVTMVSLRLAGIPWTVFTLAGGALALGVGFGSQNLVNNFLSGLILMFERPIKVGDFIEVDGVFGEVETIGARSTRVRAYGNKHIIVPNSSFLEKNVVNWTLADRYVRLQVNVGVAYGSPTVKVKELLEMAVREEPQVTENRKPEVLFTDFGDNSLNFQLLFWIHLQDLNDRRIIESNVRFIIDRLFREAGITIAFPQRDVHLDGLSPIKVELTTPAEKQP